MAVHVARVVAVVVGLLALGGTGVAAAEPPVVADTTALPCRQAIDSRARPVSGFAAVLDVIALPARPLGRDTGDSTPGHWFWFKQGLEIRAKTSSTITVPNRWRGHLAIGWGSPAAPSEQVTIDRCTASYGRWLGYPGGYWVDRRACVPLIVRTGTSRKVVHVGLGVACSHGRYA